MRGTGRQKKVARAQMRVTRHRGNRAQCCPWEAQELSPFGELVGSARARPALELRKESRGRTAARAQGLPLRVRKIRGCPFRDGPSGQAGPIPEQTRTHGAVGSGEVGKECVPLPPRCRGEQGSIGGRERSKVMVGLRVGTGRCKQSREKRNDGASCSGQAVAPIYRPELLLPCGIARQVGHLAAFRGERRKDLRFGEPIGIQEKASVASIATRRRSARWGAGREEYLDPAGGTLGEIPRLCTRLFSCIQKDLERNRPAELVRLARRRETVGTFRQPAHRCAECCQQAPAQASAQPALFENAESQQRQRGGNERVGRGRATVHKNKRAPASGEVQGRVLLLPASFV